MPAKKAARQTPARVSKASSRTNRKPRATAAAKKATARKRPAQMAPSSTPLQWVRVTLRLPDNQNFELTSSPRMQSLAMQLAYIARNRQRWTETESAREELYRRSETDLKELGLNESAIEKIARAGIVEVSIPWVNEETGWEARVLPWEFLLSSATRRTRGNQSLLVIRHLDCPGHPAGTPLQLPRKLLFVESAPGQLRKLYSFESERRLVETNLSLTTVTASEDPTLPALRDMIDREKPDVIHLAGYDTYQGTSLLPTEKGREKSEEKKERAHDGYFLTGNDGKPLSVGADQLATILQDVRAHPPALVACNFYRSAARVAPQLVAAGAQSVISFQNDIDDALAENFFATFYQQWNQSNWNLLEAFQQTFATLSRQPGRLRGTGIVLWSSRSLLHQAKRAHKTAKKAAVTTRIPLGADHIEIQVHEAVNYSLLHNNRGLFQTFKISNLTGEQISGLKVEVVLYAGGQEFPYRSTFDVTEAVKDLTADIKVPLTSALARSLREGVRTILFVEVSHSDRLLRRNTFRVTLLPIEEWKDTDRERYWLPSFVLPRDPAVSKIIDSAQRYLMAIKDDPNAGFDGYQSEADENSIDNQVRAIWAALSYDHPLSYVNPPPSFSEASQRLRTPSDILQGRRGTCIDLALLLAACLEYVDIYPVIFLLEGHAFPGYWRSWDSYERFRQLVTISAAATASEREAQEASGNGQRFAWALPQSAWREVIELVRSGDLVPLESVWLTQHRSFSEAMEDGLNNLSSKREFNCLMDIRLARESDVTPLPIAGMSG